MTQGKSIRRKPGRQVLYSPLDVYSTAVVLAGTEPLHLIPLPQLLHDMPKSLPKCCHGLQESLAVRMRLERVVLGGDLDVEERAQDGDLLHDVLAHAGDLGEEEDGEDTGGGAEAGSSGAAVIAIASASVALPIRAHPSDLRQTIPLLQPSHLSPPANPSVRRTTI